MVGLHQTRSLIDMLSDGVGVSAKPSMDNTMKYYRF